MRPTTTAPFDPRALLALTALYGLLIWKTGPAGLMVCAAAFAVFALLAGRPPVPAGGFGRACGVALFWGFLKLAGDAFTIGPAEVLGRLPGLLPQAGILSLRLFLLLTLGLGLIVALPMWVVLALVWIVCTLIAAFKAYDGQMYRYPLTIRLFK